MKRTFVYLLILITGLSACSGQNQDEKKINPKTDIKVNKEYDDQGNLVRYDSTYSYYYSNTENDLNARDSILNKFKSDFNSSYFSDKFFFNDFYRQDSSLDDDFYTKDFFLNRFRDNNDEFEQFFREADSIKNEFFRKQFPPK